MNFTELFNYLKNKYPEPQVRGKNFELYAKWFLENDSVYKKIFKRRKIDLRGNRLKNRVHIQLNTFSSIESELIQRLSQAVI